MACFDILLHGLYICSSFMKRSLSDGNIICESELPMGNMDVGHNQPLSDISQGSSKGISESAPAISTCESAISYHRYACIASIYMLPREAVLTVLGLYWCWTTVILYIIFSISFVM